MANVPPHADYRADLDGLRAFAILPVLLFHAGLPGFSGGFVGVDVFFVLSGYFMATIILKELDRGSFSFRQFYMRRIRRILPALFTMITVTAAAAYFLLMPQELEYFADSVKAAALFISNVLFERESGYFDLAAEAKPLLHTWSLSIEEQFYIIFPLALFAAHRFARTRLLPIFLAVALASFVASSWEVFHAPTKAFYLLHFRIWELLAGSLIAFLPRRDHSPRISMAMAMTGIAGILTPVFLYSAETPFPGIHAALPVASAALIIHARSRSGLPALLLTNWAAVGIGRISYSLYLWHWPIIVFFRYFTGHDLTIPESLVVIGLSFGVAYLSWRFVEQPARYGAWASSRIMIFGLSGSAIAAAVIFGTVVRTFDGIPQRLPKDVYTLYAATYDQSPYMSQTCFADSDGKGLQGDAIRQGKLCDVGAKTNDAPDFLIWGDSHAAAIASAIDTAATRVGLNGEFVGRASCPPLPDTEFGPPAIVKRCKDYNAAVVSLVRRKHFPYVFLAGYWPKYVHRSELPGEGIFFDPNVAPHLADWSAPVRSGLERTIEMLEEEGAQVILVMDVPEMGADVPEDLARDRMRRQPLEVGPPRSYTDRRQALARKTLTDVARETGSIVVDPLSALCDAKACHAIIDGKVLYKDSDHLSLTGARLLAPVFDRTFAEMKSVLQ